MYQIKDILNKIICGNALEELKKLPENSIDSIVTDPPYGLEFMGKDWDKFKQGKNIAGGTTLNTPYANKVALPSFYQLSKKRFGKAGEEGENDLKVKKNFKVLPRFFSSDLLTYQEFTYRWAKECLRVLKPGGYLLSFGGPRTYHRMACAIEDAGFEIRDCIMWVTGTGFPKSLNIGKQIEKKRGIKIENKSEFTEFSKQTDTTKHIRRYKRCLECGKLLYGQDPCSCKWRKDNFQTPEATQWKGWGTAFKPAYEPIVVARKSISEKNIALNVLKWGTGGINIDGCRVGIDKIQTHHAPKGTFAGGEPRKSDTNYYENQGRFPANFILECICDKLKEGKEFVSGSFPEERGETAFFGLNKKHSHRIGKVIDKAIIHTNPECPCHMLDKQSGIRKGWSLQKHNIFNPYGGNALLKSKTQREGYYQGFNDTGGASRFFYVAKASRKERDTGLPEGQHNLHPTVKSLKLLEYLVKLVTPPNGIILDPFIGSGTTAMACKKLGFNFIGIEKEKKYCEIAEARIKATPKPLF